MSEQKTITGFWGITTGSLSSGGIGGLGAALESALTFGWVVSSAFSLHDIKDNVKNRQIMSIILKDLIISHPLLEDDN